MLPNCKNYCAQHVTWNMKYNYCTGPYIKKGKYNGVQKYQCKTCAKYQRSQYCQRRYDGLAEQQVRMLNKESVSINSMGRSLKIPRSSIQMLIEKMAKEEANLN